MKTLSGMTDQEYKDFMRGMSDEEFEKWMDELIALEPKNGIFNDGPYERVSGNGKTPE